MVTLASMCVQSVVGVEARSFSENGLLVNGATARRPDESIHQGDVQGWHVTPYIPPGVYWFFGQWTLFCCRRTMKCVHPACPDLQLVAAPDSISANTLTAPKLPFAALAVVRHSLGPGEADESRGGAVSRYGDRQQDRSRAAHDDSRSTFVRR